ncbi:MAG: protein kinase [Aphanothece sp. CMT-3BRIN-NPC111]|jgi:serine/threonine protein kinase|nr:protein kinase [Aphanothece sp. CMT-3BRIN-NPC111]
MISTNPIANDPYIGELVAQRLQIISQIGYGGMGSVYYAEDRLQKGKSYAVKFLSSNLVSETLHKRFAREAYISAQLAKKSRHIVRVLCFGMHKEEIPYLVMEFIKGTTIKNLLKHQVFSLLPFIIICRQVCLGLQVAHEGVEINGKILPIIHRDIKPTNIMVTKTRSKDNLVKLIDFGTAKLIGDAAHLTETRDFIGSLLYSSPEQMEGNELDYRSDIYSLGVVMFEMLSGKSPWGNQAVNSYGAWYKIHSSQPPNSFQDTNPNLKIPHELENLVRKCLAKNPDERPQSAREILFVLSEIGKKYFNLPEPNLQSETTVISHKTSKFLEKLSVILDTKKGFFKFNFMDLHAILGVPVDADINTIRKRYKSIALLLHPDTCSYKNPVEKEHACQLLSKIVTPAYIQLSKEREHQEYLKLLAEMVNKLTLAKSQVKIDSEDYQNLDLENVYKSRLQTLSDEQYESLDHVIDAIGMMSELNMVYLLQKEKSIHTNQESSSTHTTDDDFSLDLTPSQLNYVTHVSVVEPYIRRATAYIVHNSFLKAIVELRDALALEPTNSSCHSLLGIAYLKQNMIAMARVHINKALQLNPEDEKALQGKNMLNKLDASSKIIVNSGGSTNTFPSTLVNKISRVFGLQKK